MSNNSQSFADRFAKKSSSFSSEQMKSDSFSQRVPKASAPEEEVSKNNNNLKQVDPQKKMQAELIYLVKGVDAGRSAWYYVLVERLKVQLFLKALSDEIIHLENYGKILFSAYGDEPPSDVTEKVKEEYGIA